MATSTFKTFLDSDKTTSRTLLHEYIPLTGTLMSGTYGGNSVWTGAEAHIKTFSHGMFQSVYDYPYLSSSSNHLMDISVGFNSNSQLSASAAAANGTHAATESSQQAKKINMYNQMAQILSGYDTEGNIRAFDQDGIFSADNNTNDKKINSCAFISLSRLLTKDEIKKGSFKLDMSAATMANWAGREARKDTAVIRITDQDDDGANSYKSNSPAGEYSILYARDLVGTRLNSANYKGRKCGLLYYQAGVVVLTSSLFMSHDDSERDDEAANLRHGFVASRDNGASPPVPVEDVGLLDGENLLARPISSNNSSNWNSQTSDFVGLLTGSTINRAADFIRSRVVNLTFNNTTELNSTVHFCRATHSEFNYSSNRTYLDGSKIRVKNQAQDMPRSYITTVGLYSANNELMAVAKLSEPIRKDPTNEVTLRVRLDY